MLLLRQMFIQRWYTSVLYNSQNTQFLKRNRNCNDNFRSDDRKICKDVINLNLDKVWHHWLKEYNHTKKNVYTILLELDRILIKARTCSYKNNISSTIIIMSNIITQELSILFVYGSFVLSCDGTKHDVVYYILLK